MARRRSVCNFTRTLTKETAAKHITPVFRLLVRALHEEFLNTLNSPVFAWNSTTKRKNGEVVSDPRNAIDLGGLRDGQRYVVVSDRTALIEWEAPYTAIVFDHATQDLVKFTIARLRVSPR